MEFNLVIQSNLWRGDELAWEDILSLAIRHSGERQGDSEKSIALVLTDDAQIQAYNRDFRGKDKPTNVLSFPSDEPDEWGDIMLAHETIAREAVGQGKTFRNHATHLLVHGMLHLMGYDHENEQEASEMESLETTILSQLSIADPYEND